MKSEIGHQCMSCKYIEPSKIGLSIRLQMAVENGVRIIRCYRERSLKSIAHLSDSIFNEEELCLKSTCIIDFIIHTEVIDVLRIAKISRINQYNKFKSQMRDILYLDIVSSQVPRNYTIYNGTIVQQKLIGFALLPKDVIEYIKLFLRDNVFIF
jgi:hypothetical protein